MPCGDDRVASADVEPTTVVLTLATLASFVADVVAIVKGKRLQGVALLLLAALLALALGVEARRSAAVQAENRLLTDTQARAQRLVDIWEGSDGDFQAFYNLTGDNEGIASAAADLMEDVKLCRPGALAEARERLNTARGEAARAVDTESTATARSDAPTYGSKPPALPTSRSKP